MGNEASSVRIHAALSAEDLKGLRGGFPGGGNGPPPCGLGFEPWVSCWHPDDRAQLERILRERRGPAPGAAGGTGAAAQQQEGISFYAYQELAGNVVRGTTEARVKLLFRLLERAPEKTIPSSELTAFVSRVVEAAARMVARPTQPQPQPHSPQPSSYVSPSSRSLAEALVQEIVFPGESAKACLHREVPSDCHLDFDAIERWLVMKCPLFEEIYVFALAASFGLPVAGVATGIQKSPLVPLEGIDWKQTRLGPQEAMFLNSQIPSDHRKKWRPLFNSSTQGENFARFSSAAVNKGPTVVVVWEKGGHVFGGFNSDPWSPGPKFFGQPSCFLFNLTPKMLSYETTRFNSNYAYFNLKQKTMPNGLGMGGQTGYFALWLDAEDYGRGKCAPSCSSFQSPQLSKEEDFQFTHLELWGVGEEPEADEESTRSALDLDPEAQAVMEMMGKTFVSKDVKAEDAQREKERKDEEERKKQENDN